MVDQVFKVRVEFPVRFAAVAAGVVLALTVVFFFVTGSLKDTFIFLAAATAAGATVTTSYYMGKTLNAALAQEEAAGARLATADTLAKKERALRYGERWNDPKMHYARSACRRVYEIRGRPVQEVLDLGNGQEKVNITNMLNFFEELSFAITHDLADEEIVRLQFGGVVTSVYGILGAWIDHERANRARPRIWIGVQQLCERWR